MRKHHLFLLLLGLANLSLAYGSPILIGSDFSGVIYMSTKYRRLLKPAEHRS